MKIKHNIIALTSDVDTESTLRIVFGADSRIGEIQVHRSLDALAAKLDQALAPLALIDIDPNPYGILESLEPLLVRHPNTKFIVLARELGSDLMLQAMQVGVRYVQFKDRIPTELPSVIQRILVASPSGGRTSGAAITVISAAGGAGCTTLAVNLANELQIATSSPVLIGDLDYAYGAVASYLELDGKYGIADVLDYEGAIDAELIETTSVRYTENLRALLSPASVSFGRHGSLDATRLCEAVNACKQRHRFTIFDAPRLSMDTTAALAMESQMTLIVLQPAVKDVRVSRNIIQALIDREVPVHRIKPVLNRYRKRREIISIEEAQKALNGITPECLSNDYVSAINGNNYGQLLADSAPRSVLRKDVMDLAAKFSALEEQRIGETEKVGAAVRRATA